MFTPNTKRMILLVLWFSLCSMAANAQSSRFTIARIKYGGGGDWYGNKSALNHLLQFIGQNTNMAVEKTETYVEPSDVKIFDYPVLYMAGHGNVKFSDADIKNMRSHLSNGGFLWCDDDYGITPFFFREMKKVFPELEFTPIPFSHAVFRAAYDFPNGMPKIHEHDGGPPEAYGLFLKGRLICFFSKNTDISDGLEGPEVFPDDGEEKHVQALKFATNIITYAINH